MELREKQKELIEKLGVVNEKSGMTPVEGRVLALLLISDETELTFDDIRELLDISKSATSNALNILQKTQKIEYITKSGDRKRYFRSKLYSWQKDTEAQLLGMSYVNNILKEILSIRTPKTQKFNLELKEVIDYMDFMQNELSQLFKKWQDIKS